MSTPVSVLQFARFANAGNCEWRLTYCTCRMFETLSVRVTSIAVVKRTWKRLKLRHQRRQTEGQRYFISAAAAHQQRPTDTRNDRRKASRQVRSRKTGFNAIWRRRKTAVGEFHSDPSGRGALINERSRDGKGRSNDGWGRQIVTAPRRHPPPVPQ